MIRKFKVLKDVKIYDSGTNADIRFSISEPRVYQASASFTKGYIYKGADRVALGKYMIENKLVEEVVDANINS